MPTTTPAEKPKGKRPTNLTLDADLVELGKEHFPTTRYKSLSRFLEKALGDYARKNAAKLKAAGLTVPASLFEKK